VSNYAYCRAGQFWDGNTCRNWRYSPRPRN
jgi:hypothetical protein